MGKRFEPEKIIAVLIEHSVEYLLIGGLAAIARQSPYMTIDIDICPSQEAENLERLAAALTVLKARRITDLESEGVKVDIDVDYLSRENEFAFMTPFGQLDIVFIPQGTRGYPDLKRGASVEEVFQADVLVPAAEDVIRMKDARGMPKDRLVVDVLRKLLAQEKKPKRRP